jgi:N-acyl-D-amino-acid deacylase
VYDDGFVERWKGKGPEYLEAVSGRFNGKRLTFETLAEMRREEPTSLIVAHVMDRAEIEDCIANPHCVVASDALAANGPAGGAHPRIAGTFPRALGVLRRRGYSWGNALRKMTVLPAERMRLDAGRLFEGAAADIAVFDPDKFADRAAFQEPFTPPDGLKLVVINGHVALRENLQKENLHKYSFSDEPHGDLARA